MSRSASFDWPYARHEEYFFSHSRSAKLIDAACAEMLDIVVTRGARPSSSVGRSRVVRTNGPRKLLPHCSSWPSFVSMRSGGVMTPALLTRTSSPLPSLRISSARAWAETSRRRFVAW